MNDVAVDSPVLAEPASAADTLLSVKAVEAGYGDVKVLWGIDMTVKAGTVACIVGSNGAGKTTLLRTLSGLIKPSAGTVMFNGQNLTGASPEKTLTAGIAQVPEGRRLFKGLAVRDNLLLGAYLRRDPRAEIEQDLERVYTMFPVLKQRYKQDASTLSGGEQQMCAIGRGLMSRPTLLMIDELSLGLAPRAVDSLSEALLEANRQGVTILLVEQDVHTAFELSSSGVVIETGRVSFSGASADLAKDERVRSAYMGI